MRKTLRASILLLALSCPALAGDMHNPLVPPPPEQPTSTSSESNTTSTQAASPDTAAMVEAALTVLQVVLSIS